MPSETKAGPSYAELKAQGAALGLKVVGVSRANLEAAVAAALADGIVPAEAPATTETAAAETPTRKRTKGDSIVIERQNAVTWWCPVCDFSMPRYMNGCAQCGAPREGDTVIPTT